MKYRIASRRQNQPGQSASCNFRPEMNFPKHTDCRILLYSVKNYFIDRHYSDPAQKGCRLLTIHTAGS